MVTLALAALAERRAMAAPFELAWSAPEGCPSSDEIVLATHAHLDEGIANEPPAFVVDGVVDQRSGRYVVVLELRDRSGAPLGEREIEVEHASCRGVVEPSALLLAMMIVVARSQTGDVTAEPPAAPPAAREPAPRASSERHAWHRSDEPAAPRPGPSAEPNARLRASFAAGTTATVGSLPNPSLGAYAQAMLARARLYAGLGLAYEYGGSVTSPGGTVGFTHASATVRAGVVFARWDRVALGAHLGARGGLLHTSPRGTFLVRTDASPTLFAGAGALARFALTRQLHLEASPELHAALRRDELEVLHQGRPFLVHHTRPLEGRLSVGLCFEVP